jgi:hypothetical protein
MDPDFHGIRMCSPTLSGFSQDTTDGDSRAVAFIASCSDQVKLGNLHWRTTTVDQFAKIYNDRRSPHDEVSFTVL